MIAAMVDVILLSQLPRVESLDGFGCHSQSLHLERGSSFTMRPRI